MRDYEVLTLSLPIDSQLYIGLRGKTYGSHDLSKRPLDEILNDGWRVDHFAASENRYKHVHFFLSRERPAESENDGQA